MMGPSGEQGRLEAASVLQIGLARNPEAPSLARAAVGGFLEGEMDAETLATVALLVSELVSNAVVHSDGPPESGVLLRARRLGNGAVRVEVTDQGTGFTPVARDPDQHGGGYGLYLVDKQAMCWGIDQQSGTCVWFEMPSPADARRRSGAGAG